MPSIKNVAIAGAAGSLGSVVFQKLVDSGKFHVRVLRRNGSRSTYPAGTDVADVDFGSVDSLKAALQGYDAVVAPVASESIEVQKNLIDASIAAGVKRFLPSEFGSNLDNPITRKLPVYGHKVQIQDYLIEKAKTTSLTYTFVYNSAFLDWGLQYDFILKISDGKPNIINGGDSVFSATTLASVGDAVVGVLSHPEETKNRTVFVDDIKVTQNQLLALAKKAAPQKDWQPQQVKLDDLLAGADARLAKGLYDMETFVPYIFRAILDPACGGNFTKTDNELLGLKGKTEEDVIDIIKKLIK